MTKFFKSIPLPMAGLTLAVLSLGNLYIAYNFRMIGEVISGIGSVLMLMILAKIIFVFEHTKKDLRNNIVASTAPTFTMGVMVICTDLLRWFQSSPIFDAIWLVSIILQLLLMGSFIYQFLIASDVEIEHIYPSWFVIFCGLGIVPITSGQFYPEIGRFIFWIALIFYFLLLPIVLYRVFIHGEFKEHEMPVITILAAPGSLCLTGYLAAFPHPNFWLVSLLVVISQVIYFVVVFKLPQLLKVQFYPSYAAFTFPMVICATALQKSYNYYTNIGIDLVWMKYIAIAEFVLATIIVFYVLFKYIEHLIKVNLSK